MKTAAGLPVPYVFLYDSAGPAPAQSRGFFNATDGKMPRQRRLPGHLRII